MRKKFTMLLASLFLVMGTAWAQIASVAFPQTSAAPTEAGWDANTTWFNISNAQGRYLYSDRTDSNGNLALQTGTAASKEDAALWCVVGGQADGYKIYNKATGTSLVLGTETSAGDNRRSKMLEQGTGGYYTAFDFVRSYCSNENVTYYAVRAHGTNSHYLNQKNNFLASWNSDYAVYGWLQNANNGKGDQGTAFMFTEVELNTLVKLTYRYVCGDVEWGTEVVNADKGQPYPAPTLAAPWGATCETLVGNVPEDASDMTVVDIECTFDATALPFKAATSWDKIEHWYYMNIHAQAYYLGYEEDQTSISLDNSKKEVPKELRDAYSWSFIGNPFTGYQVVNLAAGNGKILSSTTSEEKGEGSTYPLMTETPVPDKYNTYWVPTSSNDRTGLDGFYLEQKGYKTHRMNRNGTVLAYWRSGYNDGSTFVVEERPMGVAAELEALIEEANALKSTFDAGKVGMAVGYYSQEAYDALVAAIGKAESLSTGDITADDVAELEAAVERPLFVLPVEGRYYYIVNNHSGDRKDKKMSVRDDKYMYFENTAGVSNVFQFESADDYRFYLYNVATCTYLSSAKVHNGGHVESFATTTAGAKAVSIGRVGGDNVVSLTPKDGAMLHAQAGGHVVAYNNTDLAGASSWTIVEVTEEYLGTYKSAVASVLREQASELMADDRLAGSEALTDLQAAKAAVEGNDLAMAFKSIPELEAAIESAKDYIRESNKSYITELNYETNTNHPVIVDNKRSNWGVAENPTALNTLSILGLTQSETDPKQQFAFITPDGGENYYLYSVQAQRYLRSDNTFAAQGQAVAFDDASSEGENRVKVRFRDIQNTNFNVGSDNNFVIDWWSEIDEGNACLITQYNTLTFDLEHALKVFNEGSDLTVKYMYYDEVNKNYVEKHSERTFLWKGDTYNITNQWDFVKIDSCSVNGQNIDVPTEGAGWSFTVPGTAEVLVYLSDDLPFAKTVLNADGSFPRNTVWYVILQNSTENSAQAWKYDETNGVTTEAISGITAYTDNHLWCFAGSKDDLKIYNKVAGSSLSLTNTDPASMVAEHEAVWKIVKSDDEATFSGKGPFCLQKGAENSYLNIKSGQLGYHSGKDKGSTIRVAANFSVKYMFKGEEQTAHSVNQLVDVGSTQTVTNPYANKYVNAMCVVNGSRIEAVNGQWSVNVSQATSVVVTITEELPFKTSTDYTTANWQYLQMNSSAWKYMQKNENDNNTSSVSVSNLTDRALWAFVGDALNGFKILNKGAEGAVLTVDETVDGTAAYMKASGDQKWTIEKGNGGFIIRQGAKECLNDHAGGGVMKIWKADASPTGAGSAFRTISASVADLADLCFPGVFTLQAERSPLLYDASANVADANKLSSGMASGIAANGNDANQQFLISESETDGLYYLYSVGAAKFVDAELNFTDYPQPVLSFESNAGNPVFPWFVKIGGKYVVPSNTGTAGNKLYHQNENIANDDGKRYRIEKVGEDMSLAQSVSLTIQYEAGLIKEASQLSNSKVYAVYTYDRGAWYHNGDDALWSTGKTAKPGDAAENADHFAFLTVNGKIYLYSVGAGKFIVKSEAQHDGMYYAAYSDTPAQTVELLAATNGSWFPVVVKLNAPSAPSQLAISNSYDYPVVMYDDLSDTGNQVRLEEIGTLDLSAVVETIEEYQMDEEAKGGLQILITEATTKNAYLENASLTDAIAAAQAALDKVGATYDELMTAKENLAAALNSALYVTEIDGFSNNYVYTFVSKRGWMGAGNTDGVISGTGADDNTNYQWAVYKSTREHYYLYNIGKAQFMGVETRNNTQMPFSATPQTTGLTFKKSAWPDYPIMFSMDNQNVVNNDKAGKMICWTGGWDVLTDEGSNHQVTIVGKIESSTLTTIAAAVELYETQGVAVQALAAAIAAAQAKVNGIGNGLGYYSTTEADADATLAAIVEFKNAITGETTVAAIEAQTAAANALVETFSVNLPEAGKFYRVKNNGGTGYLNGNGTSGRAKFDGGVNDANSVFYYVGGKLLSYKTGTYLAAKIPSGKNANFLCYTEELNVGTDITFKESPALGKLLIVFDNESRSFYSANTGESDAAPAGNNGENYRFTVEEVTSLPVTISNAQVRFDGNDKYVSTLFTPVALNIPDGITAYIGVDEDNYLAMEPLENIIPANTGVILMANDAKTYDFAISTAAGTAIEPGENIITGTVAKAIITPENATCYVLADGEDGVGLYRASLNKNGGKGFLNNACKAYIPVETPAEQAAKALTMRLGRGSQGGTTSIESSELNAQGSALIYDLQGRRVLNPTKGVYIVNGKKMVIK